MILVVLQVLVGGIVKLLWSRLSCGLCENKTATGDYEDATPEDNVFKH